MANFSATFANTRIFPFRDYDEHEVINLFSKDVTGVAGELVRIVRSTPSSSMGFSNTSVGATFNRVYSNRFEVTDKIKACPGGRFVDTKYNVLGLTLNATLDKDENDMPIRYNEQRKRELQCVVSGEAVPVLRRGLVGIYGNGYIGTPTPGYAVVPHSGGGGMLHFIDPTVLAFFNDTGNAGGASYNANQVIGYCMSSSGTESYGVGGQGGWALITLEL